MYLPVIIAGNHLHTAHGAGLRLSNVDSNHSNNWLIFALVGPSGHRSSDGGRATPMGRGEGARFRMANEFAIS